MTDNVDLPQYGKESGEQEVGTSFTYDKSTVITELISKGYKLVDGGEDVPSEVAKGAKTITILVEHDTVPVTPENPGEPINPNDPDGPKWPEGTDENSVKRTGTQTIHYVGAGDKTPSDDVQTFDFTRNMVVDKVTGKVIDGGSWNVTSHTFGYKDTPVIDGYHADKRNAGGTVVTPDDLNKIVTVNYSQNGKIIPTDPSGTPIPNVPTPSYTNDPTDPTKVVSDEPVPAITGKTPDKTSVTPVDPTKDTPVVYKDNEVPATPNSQKAVVNFIDVNTGKLIKTSGILSGRPGEDINKLYSSAEVIKQLEEAGYEVVYNAFDGDGVTKYFDDDDNTTQQFTVALKLKEKAKTPDPVVPAPETPAKEPEAPVEKVSRPEQSVKQNVSVPTPQKPVEKKTNNKKEVLPQTGADHNEAASILGAVAAAIGMTSLIGAKRRKKDDK